MGRAKEQTERFLREHPFCIFCGGGTPAVGRDHVPSRQLFYRRHWPKGFEFPACRSCNGSTSSDEQIVAMLARMYPDADTEAERKEVREILAAVARNRSDVLLEMMPSARQVRKSLKRRGITKPLGTSTSDVPVLAIGPKVHQCVRAFTRKLITALHYKETSLIIPREGGIAWRWFSNFDALEGNIPESMLKLLGGRPAIQRASKNLEHQFNYIWGGTPDRQMAAYFVTFNFSFAIVGIASMHVEKLETAPEDHVLRPLDGNQLNGSDTSYCNT